MKNLQPLLLLILPLLFSSCYVTRPGNIYIKQRLGKLQENTRTQGVIFRNPATTQIISLSTRTINGELKLNLPSKEGLNVETEVSVLFRINPDDAIRIVKNLGSEDNCLKIVKNTFRSSAADVTAEYFAKDMHSGKRKEIEAAIKVQMSEVLEPLGFVVEAVLLKSISLPEELYAAVENKLKAEQEAQRMEFVLQTARQEAEKKRIEAEGTRDAQMIIQEGMTDKNIAWRSLQVLQELASSENAKLIITDGKAPVLINE